MKSALELRAELLAVIDRRRVEAGDPLLCANLEHAILDEDLRDLDRDILTHSEPSEGQLVPVRRKKP